MDEEAIFTEALKTPPGSERQAYLDRACAGDARLRAEVEALLQAHAAAGSFLDSAPPGAELGEATQLMEGPGAGPGSLGFLEPCDKPGRIGRLGLCEVIEVIGRGGMGVVLRAWDPKLRRMVAIKVLAPELAVHPTAAKRFLGEAQKAAAVVHDHVVTIHAVDDAHRPPYLVMEYIEGQTLQQKIDKEGALPLVNLLRIGTQVAEGLAAAHGRGLIHRDVKPSNILLENGVERVKISDFGLARAAADVRATGSGVVAGTPLYMSPEQAEGKPVDYRSDLFSLGSVLYAMATGRPAFRGDTPLAVMRRVCDDAPRPVREVNPEVPEWLARVIDRLLQKDPDLRYQSAGEVAGILGGHLAHLQTPSTVPVPPSVPAVEQKTVAVRRSSRVRRLAVAAAALLVGSLLTAAAICWFTPPSGIDLLAVIDPARDAPLKRWRKDGNALVYETGGVTGDAQGYLSFVKVPFVMPAEYDLEVDVERPWGKGQLQVLVTLEEEIFKANFDQEIVAKSRTVCCQVRREGPKGRVRALCDQSPVGDLVAKEKPARGVLGCDENTVSLWNIPQESGVLKVTRISLKPVTGSGHRVDAGPQNPGRQAAVDAVWRGGAVRLATGEGRVVEAKNLKSIPQEAGTVVAVDLGAPANLEGGLNLVDGLDGLKRLSVRDQVDFSEGRLSWLISPGRIQKDQGDRGAAGDVVVSLEELDLAFTGITDRMLALLKPFRNLRSLNLAGTAITDKGLDYLLDLGALEELDVSGTRITDAGLEALSRFKGLKRVHLNQTSVRGEALEPFAGVPRLEVLSLIGNAGLTDDSLPVLGRLKSLRELSLVGTGLSARGLAALRQALPTTTLEHSTDPAADLLPLVALSEGWTRDGKVLISPVTEKAARVPVGYRPPGEYLLEMEFTSPDNFWRSVGVIFPCGGAQSFLALDMWPQLGSWSGLETVDGWYGGVTANGASVRGRIIPPATATRLWLAVRRNNILAGSEVPPSARRLIVDWTGAPIRLAANSQGLMVHCFKGSHHFSMLRLTPIARVGPGAKAAGEPSK